MCYQIGPLLHSLPASSSLCEKFSESAAPGVGLGCVGGSPKLVPPWRAFAFDSRNSFKVFSPSLSCKVLTFGPPFFWFLLQELELEMVLLGVLVVCFWFLVVLVLELVLFDHICSFSAAFLSSSAFLSFGIGSFHFLGTNESIVFLLSTPQIQCLHKLKEKF